MNTTYCDQVAVALLRLSNDAKDLTVEERDYIKIELREAYENLGAVLRQKGGS